MKKSIIVLSLILIICTFVSSGIGLFYEDSGQSFEVESVHGEKVEMFGSGIYRTESMFKAPINKGTDAIIFVVIIPMFIFALIYSIEGLLKAQIIHLICLTVFLYYSASVAFSVSYNRLFLVYIIQFSVCLCLFICQLKKVASADYFDVRWDKTPQKGLIAFLIFGGLSVFVWLIEIIVSLKSGNPLTTLGMSTTEPTFVLDIGIIAPACFYTAYLIYHKKLEAYIYAVLLLSLNAVIGLIVISQTFFQYNYGVINSLHEYVIYVGIFAVMSVFALVLDVKVIKALKMSQAEEVMI